MARPIAFAVATVAALLIAPVAKASPILGQIDTFTDGTTDSWTNGPAPDPVNTLGGPDGPTDRFLMLTATGSPGPGGRLTVFNRLQWSGDYLAAGVDEIAMDLKNFSHSQLEIRVAFKSSLARTSPGVVSLGFILPVDGLWHHAVFLIDAPDLIGLNGGTAATVLPSVAEMRIINSASPNLNGDVIVGQLGVDNISAVPATTVPEPASLILLATTGVAMHVRRQLRKRRVGRM